MTDILNWRRIDDRITTSGQPSRAQLYHLRDLGVIHIFNLAPHSSKNALADEADIVAGLGMTYVNIPVDFDAPQERDFAAFRNALAKTGSDPVHVHCIYNARVSAFFYRLMREQGIDPSCNLADVMDSIWRPGGVWASFIGRPGDAEKPNRYAGYDY